MYDLCGLASTNPPTHFVYNVNLLLRAGLAVTHKTINQCRVVTVYTELKQNFVFTLTVTNSGALARCAK